MVKGTGWTSGRLWFILLYYLYQQEKAYDFSEPIFWKVEGKTLAKFDIMFK